MGVKKKANISLEMVFHRGARYQNNLHNEQKNNNIELRNTRIINLCIFFRKYFSVLTAAHRYWALSRKLLLSAIKFKFIV